MIRVRAAPFPRRTREGVGSERTRFGAFAARGVAHHGFVPARQAFEGFQSAAAQPDAVFLYSMNFSEISKSKCVAGTNTTGQYASGINDAC
jgi:hypothetical protein